MLSCTARKKMQVLIIWDLLAGQTSCSAELSTKKSFINSGPDLISPHILGRKHHPPFWTCLWLEYISARTASSNIRTAHAKICASAHDNQGIHRSPKQQMDILTDTATDQTVWMHRLVLVIKNYIETDSKMVLVSVYELHWWKYTTIIKAVHAQRGLQGIYQMQGPRSAYSVFIRTGSSGSTACWFTQQYELFCKRTANVRIRLRGHICWCGPALSRYA